jgi:alpha-galactosidase
MGNAIKALSRPMQLDLCIWGQAYVWTWGATVGQSWRIFYDSNPTWSYITSIISINVQYLNYIDFYAHNDMDMMEIGECFECFLGRQTDGQ